MTITLKMTGRLYDEIRHDLERPHPFAFERVGFVSGRLGTGASGAVILLTRYQPIPDAHYIDDPTVGARIGPNAMAAAMQSVFHRRTIREGIFHVHLHGVTGETGMSPTDAREIPPMMPGFRSVGSEAPHGIVILSLDHGSAWVCLPGHKKLMACASINVIGAPLHVFDRRARP